VEPPVWPDVVAIVPARDEAAVLPETLPTLFSLKYPGRFRVVLVDDGSTDGTADIARSLGEVEVVPARGRPAGWAGKVWAMSEGVRAAGEPEFFLFTDADIAYAPGTLTALVRAASEGRDLVSQMATLTTDTAWERLIVPAFVYFFSQLYPFRLVEDGRTAAAAGGCMLIRRGVLERAGGLEAIRGAVIDDVAMGRLIKRRGGGRCRLDLSHDVVSRRPYPRLADLWNMVARSAYDQLRYSPTLLAGTVLGMLLVYVAPPVATLTGAIALAMGDGVAPLTTFAAGAVAWAFMSLTYAPMLRFYGLSVLRAPALPFVGLMYTGMTLDSARRHHTGQGASWKGRVLS
jgi:hopene-associated glycosyltransferase HpnB